MYTHFIQSLRRVEDFETGFRSTLYVHAKRLAENPDSDGEVTG
jgi:hypothetical protein